MNLPYGFRSLTPRPVPVNSAAEVEDVRRAYMGSEVAPAHAVVAPNGRKYVGFFGTGVDRPVLVLDVTNVRPAAQAVERGSPTAGAWFALAAFAGLLGFWWLSRPEPKRGRR